MSLTLVHTVVYISYLFSITLFFHSVQPHCRLSIFWLSHDFAHGSTDIPLVQIISPHFSAHGDAGDVIGPPTLQTKNATSSRIDLLEEG